MGAGSVASGIAEPLATGRDIAANNTGRVGNTAVTTGMLGEIGFPVVEAFGVVASLLETQSRQAVHNLAITRSIIVIAVVSSSFGRR